ncbi:hypothetical protein TCAL_11892, partial [Tigriopus californicus]
MMIPLHHHPRHQSSWLRWFYQLKNSRNPNRYYFFSVICAIVLSLPFLFVIENASWTRKNSRDMRVYVKPEEITTIAHPSTLHSYSHMLEVVIAIHSHPNNFDERDAIRHMWMHHAIATGKIAVIFCIGKSPERHGSINTRVLKESDEFGDILLEDFIDTYDNLTIKSTLMLKYFHNNDIGTKVIFKADDDVFVNPTELLRQVRYWSYATDGFQKVMFGHAYNSPPIRLTTIFAPQKKWIMPRWMYPEDLYPTYLSGSGYIIPSSEITCLYEAALETPLVYLEDVFVTGILAETCGIRRQHNEFFLPNKRSPCLLNDSNFILAHGIKLKDKEIIQEILTFGYSEHC